MKDQLFRGSGPASESGVPSAHKLFFQEFIRSMGPTASLVPSSRYLANALLAPIDFQRAQTIVELGPGTGPITREILRRLRPDARIFAVEINDKFINYLQSTIDDPRLIPVCGSATDLQAMLLRHGAAPVDAVVSSLGLTSMDAILRTRIMGQIVACLSADGIMTQYQYVHAYPGHLDLEKLKFSRFDEPRFLRKFFGGVSVGHVLRNFPPALVFTCRKIAVKTHR